MPISTPDLIASRREEIMNACEKLYQTMSFSDITLKEIGSETSFTRTSIYNYFSTKEEIFLALLKREYDLWTGDLRSIRDIRPELPADGFARRIADSFEKRVFMLKLLAMDLYDIEESTSLEKLTDFKISYKAAIDTLGEALAVHFPYTDERERQEFIYALLPFMFGVYPYAFATEKQKKAMDSAGLRYPEYSVSEIIFDFLNRIL